MPDVAALNDAKEMLDAGLELTGIRFDRLAIDLTDTMGEDGETPLEIECVLGTRQEGSQFGARFEFQVTAPQWSAAQGFELSEQAPADFASKVAIMAAFPYIREALANLTMRVTGAAALLPIIRQGELTFRSKP